MRLSMLPADVTINVRSFIGLKNVLEAARREAILDVLNDTVAPVAKVDYTNLRFVTDMVLRW